MEGWASWTSFSFFLAGREAGFAQGNVRVPAPLLLDGVDHPPEDGIGVVERATASGPLRTLSGEDHGHPSLALVHGGHRSGVIHECVQGLAELSEVAYRQCRAGGEVRAAPAEIPRQGVEIGVPLIQASPEVPCALPQGVCRARRQRNHVACPGSNGYRPHPGLRRPVFPNYTMPVGTPETEGIDADHDRAVGERLACRLHLHGAAVEVDFQVGRQEVPRDRREGAPLHHHHDLEQRAAEGGRFQVPDVALDAGHAQGDLAFDATEGLGDGIPLDSVAYDGAGGMRLDVVEVLGPQPRALACGAHQFDLRMTGRSGDVPALGKSTAIVGGSRRIHRGGFDHRVDVVAVPFGGFQRLDGEYEGPFGTHVAVGVGIERMTPAVGTDDAEGIERDAAPGRTQVGRRSHQGAVAVALHHRVHRRMQGGERSGAGSGAGNRRPHQVQVVGDAVGQHRGVDAQDGELVGPVHRAPVGR